MGVASKKRIYLDYQASTPCDPRVTEAMLRFLAAGYGNPSSPHWAGDEAERGVESARESMAAAIGCLPREVVFTSGATEANNLAILGSATASDGTRRKIITTPIEHKSILLPCEHLAARGMELVMCPVRRDGLVDLGALADLSDEQTLLISVQLANNEIGTLEPLLEVCQIAHRVGASVHTDAAQALGRIPIDVENLGVDLLSLSAHKCYGPKGVGALYVRGGVDSGRIEPITFGGGQEGGLRPGTTNVPGVVGLGAAAKLSTELLESDARRSAVMRDRFEVDLTKAIPGALINGAIDRRLPGITSITLPGVDADAVLANAPELAISSSSACSAGAPEPSHVLSGIGLTREEAYSTLRISFGRFTQESEAEYATSRLAEVVALIQNHI